MRVTTDPKKGTHGPKWIEADPEEVLVHNWTLVNNRIPAEVYEHLEKKMKEIASEAAKQ